MPETCLERSLLDGLVKVCLHDAGVAGGTRTRVGGRRGPTGAAAALAVRLAPSGGPAARLAPATAAERVALPWLGETL